MNKENLIPDEKAVTPGMMLAAAILGIAVLVVLGTAVMLGTSTEKAVKSGGSFTRLDVRALDSNTLEIEHRGGEPLDLGEDIKIYFYHKGLEYEIPRPSGPTLLEVGDSIELSLPEGVEMEKGENSRLLIRNEKKRKDIYRTELSFG